MFYNISNHPSKYWSAEQLSLARKMAGDIVDIPFPDVSPYDNAREVSLKAHEFAQELLSSIKDDDIVHVMGEHTFMFALVSALIKYKIRCVASTTERSVTYSPSGDKTSTFHFVAFRNYYNPNCGT